MAHLPSLSAIHLQWLSRRWSKESDLSLSMLDFGSRCSTAWTRSEFEMNKAALYSGRLT
jgi:hypothetical protein